MNAPTPFRQITRLAALGIPLLFLLCLGFGIWVENRLTGRISLSDQIISIVFFTFSLLGALLISRRPDHPVGWILAAIGLVVIFPAAESYTAFVLMSGNPLNLLAILGVWANEVYWIPLIVLIFIYLPLLFPDGRLPSRRWTIPAWIPGISAAGLAVLGAFRETLTGMVTPFQIANPIGIPGLTSPFEHPLASVFFAGIFAGQAAALAAVVVRFRRSRDVERQQMKWFLFAVSIIPLSYLGSLFPLLGDIPFGLSLASIPAATAIAILRYRLYDIDVIIRKTVVYSVVTAVLAAVYFGSVVLLQRLTEQLTGSQSPLAIVLSTLAIAALFSPLQRRVQAAVDRRFFRQKYDAQQVLAQFGRTAQVEMTLEAVTEGLERVMRETMRPEKVVIWLKSVSKRSV